MGDVERNCRGPNDSQMHSLRGLPANDGDPCSQPAAYTETRIITNVGRIRRTRSDHTADSRPGPPNKILGALFRSAKGKFTKNSVNNKFETPQRSPQYPPFKQDCWSTVTTLLQSHPECKWAASIDLRNWFFHLGLAPQGQRWVRVRTPEGGIQFNAMPFGLQSSPF